MDSKIELAGIEDIILLGSGGHAKVVVDIIEKSDKYRIAGVVTDESLKTFLNYPVLGRDEVLPTLFSRGIKKVVMGIGGNTDNTLRKKVFINTKRMGFDFISAIDPTAIISRNVIIGEGVVIFPGVIINTSAVIGNNVIIATGSTIDHETKIEDHVLVSAGVSVGARDLIQEGALLAIGSIVISGLKIGREVVVGAGAVVIRDLEESGVYIGVPARKMPRIDIKETPS